ncbi:MAG: VCBS repeat-containing protein, partial [Bacteroidota bacterium]
MKNLFYTLTITILLISSNVNAQTLGAQQIIDSSTGLQPIEVFWSDLNGDGFEDALVGSIDNRVIWYANDGMGGFGPAQVVITAPYTVTACRAADLNGDGSNDIYFSMQDSQGFLLGGVLWLANNGTGSFGLPQNIGFLTSGPQAIDAADFDGDGDIDVVVAIGFENEFSWFENINGTFTEHVFHSVLAPLQVVANDIDQDGDQDIITYALGTTEVTLHENTGGGIFASPVVITSSQTGTVRLFVADIDGDGNRDIITSSTMGDNISWWENDGTTNFTTQHVIYGLPG